VRLVTDARIGIRSCARNIEIAMKDWKCCTRHRGSFKLIHFQSFSAPRRRKNWRL